MVRYPSPTLGSLPLPISLRSLSPILAATFMPPRGRPRVVVHHPRQLGELPVKLHFVTMVAKRQLLAICLLQPLLGRNARGFRRDASG